MNLQVKFSEDTEAFNGKLGEDDLSVQAGFGETQNVGTNDHEQLVNRCIPDQHCIGAITGLEEALNGKLTATFGTTEGTAFEGSAGAKNTEDIAFLKQALIQSGTITGIEVEQAYTSRVTANGENIVDGQKTPVTLIKGDTVRCENLVDIDKMLRSNPYDLFTKNDDVYTLTKVSNSYRFSTTLTFSTPLKAGVYSYGAEYIEFTGTINIWLQAQVNFVDGTSTTIGLSKGASSSSMTFAKDIKSIAFYSDMNNPDGSIISFKNFMFCEGETLKPYTPYFTELKHAYIDKIVSTGHNLFDISKLVGGALTDNGDGTYTMTKNGNSRFSANWYLDTPFYLDLMSGSVDIISDTTTSGYGLILDLTTIDGDHPSMSFNGRQYSASGRKVTKMTLCLYHNEPDGVSITFKNLFMTRNKADLSLGYNPFVQETYQLPETLELGKWDSFNPQTGEIVRGTGTATSETGFTEEEIATYDMAIVSTDGKTIEYKLATPTVEKLENAPKTYTAYYQGNEAVVQGETDNSAYGAMPTIKNEYFKLKES